MAPKSFDGGHVGELGRGAPNSDAASELGGSNPDAVDAAFAERMERLIGLTGGVAALMDRSGVSRRMIDKYRSGRVDPSRERLIALAKGAGVSLEWLATGEGAPERGAEVPGSDDVVALPRYSVAAAAGNGSQVAEESVVESVYFRREFLRQQLGLNPSALVIISASGDSMAPTIEDGDLLVVDAGEQRWKSDGIYVIGVEDEVWVKRLAKRLDGGLVISSDNPKYAHTTETIERADIRSVRLIGRVVWVGGRI